MALLSVYFTIKTTNHNKRIMLIETATVERHTTTEETNPIEETTYKEETTYEEEYISHLTHEKLYSDKEFNEMVREG